MKKKMKKKDYKIQKLKMLEERKFQKKFHEKNGGSCFEFSYLFE